MGDRRALTEGWFKSMTPGARKAHLFRDGDRLSACHMIRRVSQEEERRGFAIQGENLGGFLTWVEPAPHTARCKLCRAALLEEDPPKPDLVVESRNGGISEPVAVGEYIALNCLGSELDGGYRVEGVESIEDGFRYSLRREVG